VEALWLARSIGASLPELLLEVLDCDSHHARAAATRSLRYPKGETGRPLWQAGLADNGLSHEQTVSALAKRAADENGIVRIEALNAASYIGTREALDAIVGAFDHPMDKHLQYAATCALGSETLSKHWKNDEAFLASHPTINTFLKTAKSVDPIEKSLGKPNREEKEFDRQKGLTTVDILCIPERLLFDKTKFTVKAGQPVKLILRNPDATQHNLVIVEPGALEEVGLAGNEMAKDPSGLSKGFIPESDKILHHTSLLNPETGEILRFKAPEKPGVYPYLCTFPGHWIVMKGEMIVEAK
jgi:azurin